MAMRVQRKDQGFALILAILSLLVLTVLGLAIASITSIDVEISSNHRWAEQARYNAEAGLEAGKRILRDLNWQAQLWSPPRTAWSIDGTDPNRPTSATWLNVTGNADAYSNASRNWEMGTCDERGGHVGYGRVVDDGTTVYQNVSTIFGRQLNGTVTLWVRRGLLSTAQGTFADDPSNDRMILTVEGTAPYAGGRYATATTIDHLRKATATYRLEAQVSRSENPGGGQCGTRAGQAGGGQEGANLGACDPLGSSGLNAALGALGAGPVSEINRGIR